MATPSLRREERTALIVAVALHIALVAALLFQPARDDIVPLPERMTVSLAQDVGLEATAPSITAAPRAAQAPVLAELLAPPEQVAAEIASSRQAVIPPQPAQPRPDAVRSQSKPAVRAGAKPAVKPAAKPTSKPGGASRIGNDFLPGAVSGSRSGDDRLPASQIGASAKASLAQAIGRQLKPKWSSPQGADAELLVTVLAFDLNPDGSLSGQPRIVSQGGVTDANRPQAGRHAELAIRAVQLAAPFDLPPEFYNAWKRISAFRFDRKLSQ